jgi:hypothetical protein
MDKRGLVAILLIGTLAGLGGYLLINLRPSLGRSTRLIEWIRNPSAHPDLMVHAGRPCGNVPFIFPSDGFIGYLWDDSFRAGHRHQGIDIYGGSQAGRTAVLSVYPGFLTRLPEWKSAVIVRVPSDPLQPGRTIWLYYTHMADTNGYSFIVPDFPPGTYEKPVQAGTLLGYQGDYSGDPNNPTGVHLHFSIVLEDGEGGFLNELDINNTLDPSPYLGLPLNAKTSDGEVIICQGASQ